MSYISRSILTTRLSESVLTYSGASRSAAGPTKRRSSASSVLDRLRKVPPLRVMIVEDEVIIAMSLESLVEDFGFEVCAIAAMGDEAVEFAKTQRPDIVLMDVNLTGDIDGVEAARRIREIIDTRIVFVTAYGSGEVLDRIQSTIPDAPVAPKPVEGATLLAAIARSGL